MWGRDWVFWGWVGNNVCCSGHKWASDLAGRPGFVKSKISGPLMRAKPTGQPYPARPLGQELGKLLLLTWQSSPTTPPGRQGGWTLRLLGYGVENLSSLMFTILESLCTALPDPPKVTRSCFFSCSFLFFLPLPFHSFVSFPKIPCGTQGQTVHSPAWLCLLSRV